jgi:hypothetical protein
MTGTRDMFKKLNAWVDDQAFLTTVLHHTGAESSWPTGENRLRFRHFRHLASYVAVRQCCLGRRLATRLTGVKFCQ